MTRIAAFGGVDPDPWALEAVLADARARGCDDLWRLGDPGGFGAACDELGPPLLRHDVRCTAGIYDIAIGRGDEDCGCGDTDDRDDRFAQVRQSSLDGAGAPVHDHRRGRGPADRAVAGLRFAVEPGLPLRVAMTATPDDRIEVAAPRALCDEVTVPEPTATADGPQGHPVAGDLQSSPEVLAATGEVPLAEGRRLGVERSVTLRRADGTLPEALRCAV